MKSSGSKIIVFLKKANTNDLMIYIWTHLKTNLIPKSIKFQNCFHDRTIFMIRNSFDYSKYGIPRSDLEFWDQL